MTPDERDDALLRGLRRLPPLEPDRARTERVRARCRAVLARRQARVERSARGQRFTALVVERVLVGGFCVIYLSAVIRDALRVHGVL